MKKYLSLIFILLCSSLVNAETIADLSAKELYVEFEKNEIAAEGRYKDKEIIISGKINEISKNIAGQPTVTLDAGTLKFVSCRFQKKSIDQLSNLQKGQDAKFVCKVNYKIFTTIHLRECTTMH